MKRRFWISALLFGALALVQFGCQRPQTTESVPPTNRNGGTEEPVDTAAIERELLRIENDWPRVVKEKDVEAVKRVLADDAVLVYPDGSIGGKADDVRDMESGAMTADSMELLDLKVHVIDKDAAFVTGRTVVKNGKYKMQDGKTIDITGEYRFVDTFARRNGQWKLVAGASVPVRAPAAGAAASPGAKASPSAAASPAASPAATRAASPAATRTP